MARLKVRKCWPLLAVMVTVFTFFIYYRKSGKDNSYDMTLNEYEIQAPSGIVSENELLFIPPEETIGMDEPESRDLITVLTRRLSQAEINLKIVPNVTCDMEPDVSRPCVNPECNATFPNSPELRLRSLLAPKFRLPALYNDVISSLAEPVTARTYILLTASSANHFHESMDLLTNLRKFVFPFLNENYTVVFVDLGLNSQQRAKIQQQTNLTLLQFPFKRLPSHITTMWCYSWKPVIVQALLPKSEFLVYMDSSVRFLPGANLTDLFQRARERGMQFLRNPQSIFLHTVDATFHYYGDVSCQYQPYPEILAGFGVYHNEPFVRRAIVEPWAACAIVKECMCPVDPQKFINCNNMKRVNNVCHRFDLSSLTIMLAKLYGEKLGGVVFPPRKFIAIMRDKLKYFDEVM